jgi:hypothetical protein
MFQPENAIPILTWIDDAADRELSKLDPVLELLSHVYDVRPYIRKLVVNDSINHKKAEAYLKTELNITIAKAKPKVDDAVKQRLFTGTRNSVDTKARVEKLNTDQNSPTGRTMKTSIFNPTLTYNQGKFFSNEKPKKPIINSYMRPTLVPSTAKALSTRDKSESFNNRDHKKPMGIYGKPEPPYQKSMNSLQTPIFTNLLTNRKENDNEKKTICVDTRKWLEYYESIRNELDKCVNAIGKDNKKTKQKVSKEASENKKTNLYLEDQWSSRIERPIINRNNKPSTSKAHFL